MSDEQANAAKKTSGSRRGCLTVLLAIIAGTALLLAGSWVEYRLHRVDLDLSAQLQEYLQPLAGREGAFALKEAFDQPFDAFVVLSAYDDEASRREVAGTVWYDERTWLGRMLDRTPLGIQRFSEEVQEFAFLQDGRVAAFAFVERQSADFLGSGVRRGKMDEEWVVESKDGWGWIRSASESEGTEVQP